MKKLLRSDAVQWLLGFLLGGYIRVILATVRWRLDHADRLWYIVLALHGRVESRPKIISALGFTLTSSWHTNAVWIWLYTRHPAQ